MESQTGERGIECYDFMIENIHYTSCAWQLCPVLSLIRIQFSGLNDYIKSLVVADPNGGFSCSMCGQSFNFACNAKTHVEARHLDTGGFQCDECGFVSKTRDSLRKHRASKHLPK